MSELLEADTIERELTTLPGWSGDPGALRRMVTATSFLAGIRLVDAVAEVAEELNHHPDIDIRWTSVTFTLSTHSAGGVTAKDVTLARRINELAG
jgi:4a-hydroxytetrahydrobiopterin dehydratase